MQQEEAATRSYLYLQQQLAEQERKIETVQEQVQLDQILARSMSDALSAEDYSMRVAMHASLQPAPCTRFLHFGVDRLDGPPNSHPFHMRGFTQVQELLNGCDHLYAERNGVLRMPDQSYLTRQDDGTKTLWDAGVRSGMTLYYMAAVVGIGDDEKKADDGKNNGPSKPPMRQHQQPQHQSPARSATMQSEAAATHGAPHGAPQMRVQRNRHPPARRTEPPMRPDSPVGTPPPPARSARNDDSEIHYQPPSETDYHQAVLRPLLSNVEGWVAHSLDRPNRRNARDIWQLLLTQLNPDELRGVLRDDEALQMHCNAAWNEIEESKRSHETWIQRTYVGLGRIDDLTVAVHTRNQWTLHTCRVPLIKVNLVSRPWPDIVQYDDDPDSCRHIGTSCVVGLRALRDDDLDADAMANTMDCLRQRMSEWQININRGANVFVSNYSMIPGARGDMRFLYIRFETTKANVRFRKSRNLEKFPAHAFVRAPPRDHCEVEWCTHSGVLVNDGAVQGAQLNNLFEIVVRMMGNANFQMVFTFDRSASRTIGHLKQRMRERLSTNSQWCVETISLYFNGVFLSDDELIADHAGRTLQWKSTGLRGGGQYTSLQIGAAVWTVRKLMFAMCTHYYELCGEAANYHEKAKKQQKGQDRALHPWDMIRAIILDCVAVLLKCHCVVAEDVMELVRKMIDMKGKMDELGRAQKDKVQAWSQNWDVLTFIGKMRRSRQSFSLSGTELDAQCDALSEIMQNWLCRTDSNRWLIELMKEVVSTDANVLEAICCLIKQSGTATGSTVSWDQPLLFDISVVKTRVDEYKTRVASIKADKKKKKRAKFTLRSRFKSRITRVQEFQQFLDTFRSECCLLTPAAQLNPEVIF